jgi:hypothetical protein
MRARILVRPVLISLFGLVSAPGAALAADAIGQVKTASGEVTLERGGGRRTLVAGERVYAADVLATGADGSCGVTFADDSTMALGPHTRLSLDRFRFDTTTHEGAFESTLERGTLAVKSGQLVKQRPESMQVRTPGALLGVRGTEFVVRADAGR